MMAKKQLPTKDMEVCRSFGMPDIRAVEEGNIIEGHAAVYNQRTNIANWFYEVIERGAFDDTDFKDVLFSANHNLRQIPLARSRNNNENSTMQLKLDDKGLYVRAGLDIDNNAESKSLYSAVGRGDINGMSFIFFVGEERWVDLDKDMPTRYISKIKSVREVSAVNFPAYEGTDINARDEKALDNAKLALENVRSELDSSRAKEIEILKLKTEIIMKGKR